MGGHAFDEVGETSNEDDIYNKIDGICDVSTLYDKHELKETGGKWTLTPANEGSERSAHTVRWQSHAMKELCDNIIKPNDDEVKDAFQRARKKKKKTKDAKVDTAKQKD